MAVFDRFTDQARRVLVLAAEEARLRNDNGIGDQHLLLGMLAAEDGEAARILGSLGVDLVSARAQADRLAGPASTIPSRESVQFTPRAKKVLEFGLREALKRGHSEVGPEHLLLALLHERGWLGVEILASLGAPPERVREAVLSAMERRERAPQLGPGAWRAVRRARLLEAHGHDTEGTGPCLRCGRPTAELSHFVVSGTFVLCDECARAADRALEGGGRRVLLPPCLIGEEPREGDLEAVTDSLSRAFGGGGAPGSRELAVGRVRFSDPDRADVSFEIDAGTLGWIAYGGRLERSDDHWLVTPQTLSEVRAHNGIRVPLHPKGER